MSWLKAIGIGLDLADAYIAEQNAKKLKELQMQGAAIALIEALIKELRNQIFNFKQTAEAILADESETPVIAAGAMKLLERQLLESGITPDVFQEITDKEYTATVIRLIRENSDRMLRRLSKEEQAEINHVASVASRLQDYEFYVENYQKGKELQKATEVIKTYKNRQGCLPILGLILYIYPGIAFPFLFAVMLGGRSEAGQSIVGFISLGLWAWGLVSILKWKNGGGYKNANKVIQSYKENFNLGYFNSLDEEFGNVEDIKERHIKAKKVAINFFKDSSLFQTSYPQAIEQTVSIEEDTDFKVEDKIITIPPHIEEKEKGLDNFSSLHGNNTVETLTLGQKSSINSTAKKINDVITPILSVWIEKFRQIIIKIKSSIPSTPKSIGNKKLIAWASVIVLFSIFTIWIVFLFYPPLAKSSSSHIPPLINSAREGTPVPMSNIPIYPQNINTISQLSQWGGYFLSVEISPDGNLIAAASSTGIHLYKTESLEEAGFLRTDSLTTDISFSPDGKFLSSAQMWLVQGEEKHSIQIWSVVENELLFTIEGHSIAAFSPDGQTLASSSEKYPVIQLWKILDGASLGKIKVNAKEISSLAFSPDGRKIAIGLGNLLQLRDVTTQSIVYEQETNTSKHITKIVFAPEGQILCLYFDSETRPQIWRISDSNAMLLHSFEDAYGNITDIDFSPDGMLLAISSNNGVNIYNTSAFENIHSLSGWFLTDVDFSPDGEKVIAISDHSIFIWLVSDGSLINTFSKENFRRNSDSLEFAQDGETLLTYTDDRINLFRVSDGLLIDKIETGNNLIFSFSVSPDGRMLAVYVNDGEKGTIQIWNITEKALVRSIEMQDSAASKLNFSADGELIAAANEFDNDLKLWNLSDENTKNILNNQRPASSNIDFSIDGQYLAIATLEGAIIWRISDGTLINKIETPNRITELLFSPDGKTLAIALLGGKVQIRRVTDWKILETLESDSEHYSANSLSFSPDGQILATVAIGKGIVKLWLVSDGTLLRDLDIHYWVDNIKFSPDGTVLAIKSIDNTIRLWGIPSNISINTPTLDSTTVTALSTVPIISTKTSIPQATLTTSYTTTPQPLSNEIIDSKNTPMRLIPAGEFSMGDTIDDAMEECAKHLGDCQQSWFKNSSPSHTIYLDSYYIDTYEVTNSRYKECVDAGICTQPKANSSYTRSNYYGDPQYNDYPVIYVDLGMAKNYCQWRGGYLPSEAQWEKAARGTDGRNYPWGENLDCNSANYLGCVGDTTSVGRYTNNISPYGLYDMAGNVSEWVADWFSENYYQESPSSNPLGPNNGHSNIIRGGSWFGIELYTDTSIRVALDTTYSDNFIGFRCASNIDSAANNLPLLSSPTPTSIMNVTTPTPITCSNFISQLQPNMEAKVITDAINMREKPGTNQTVVGIIYTGDKVQLSSEPPICGDGYLWWKVQSVKLGITGWVVEGIAEERWLLP